MHPGWLNRESVLPGPRAGQAPGEVKAMRLLVASLALLGVSSAALAQDRGSLAFDLMTTAGRHVGLGYYLTDGLSIRPSVGVAFSSQAGTEFNLGTDLRYELLRGSRLSPYATAGFNYMRNPYLVQYDSAGNLESGTGSNVARYGAGVGVRARLKYHLSAVAEGRVMNSELKDIQGGAFYGQQAVRNGAHFEAAVGVSYAFN
jgi:hypothetical protein